MRNAHSAAPPTGAWSAFRKLVPLTEMSGLTGAQSIPTLTANFLRNTPASTFYGDLPGVDVQLP